MSTSKCWKMDNAKQLNNCVPCFMIVCLKCRTDWLEYISFFLTDWASVVLIIVL